MKKSKLEIACFNLESAIVAQANGADRIEFCTNRNAGGITPDLEIFKMVRHKVTIDMYVMIRPRSGNFVYSDFELEQMKASIVMFKEAKADGFVFGVLKANGSVHQQQNCELVALAKPLPCTFHRAFDEVENTAEALESILKCGFKTVLTSGQAENSVDGIEVLATLIKKAGNRIAIMPGGGLRSSNLELLKVKMGNRFYHSSAIVDSGEIANGEEIQAIKANLDCK